jgi:hypothetical protein
LGSLSFWTLGEEAALCDAGGLICFGACLVEIGLSSSLGFGLFEVLIQIGLALHPDPSVRHFGQDQK